MDGQRWWWVSGQRACGDGRNLAVTRGLLLRLFASGWCRRCCPANGNDDYITVAGTSDVNNAGGDTVDYMQDLDLQASSGDAEAPARQPASAGVQYAAIVTATGGNIAKAAVPDYATPADDVPDYASPRSAACGCQQARLQARPHSGRPSPAGCGVGLAALPAR